ncbi:MAG: tetratricopeptide repeat protein [Anaerolineaceae bacterium]|nr:MAG: tetratricopeptide repeat protein [Anaerolineaceae bacterium]
MAEISLRAYVKEVDHLVEQEQLDEAIAHCRHILETYPKHVDTYRILGKAYLEAKRFGDAADIFQRVLSAVPDDFVAHIGMAIVREDEGNLDAAIWHIERAFETNPANPAIQQELRRLIGRRDGLEPHKVRMTRGALARMYAHGELYPQAIAELTSALKDDSDRPDLEALLATMYWRSSQDVEASDVCNRILDKLPHCREANRILAAILQASNKMEDAKLYHRRLAGLDPYAAFVETANIDPQTVDENMVRLRKLDWEPGKPMPAVEPGQPEWAASLGVDLGKEEEPEEVIVPDEAEKPAWLLDLEKPIEPVEAEEIGEPVEPSTEPVPSPEPAAEAEIPDWMREAGWQEATGEAVETPISFTEEELSALGEGEPLPEGEPTEEGELAPADIPGWLQDIAPPEEEPTTPEPTGVVEGEAEMGEIEDIPDWLSEIDEGIAEIQPEIEEPISIEPEVPIDEPAAEIIDDIVVAEPTSEEELVEEKGTGGLPTWLESETPGATTTIVTWLGDRDTGPPPDEIPEDLEEALDREPVSEISEEADDEIPTWLAEDAAPEPVEPPDDEAPPPWLAEIAETAEEVPSEDVVPEPIEPVAADEAPSWLSEIAEIPAEEEPEAAVPDEIEPIEEVEAPSWLAGVAEVAAEEVTEPEDVEPVEEAVAPSWLDEVAEVAAEEAPEPEVVVPEAAEPIEEGEAPSWLAGVAEVAAEEEAPAIPEEPSELEPTPAVSEDDVPEWLKSISEPGVEPSVEPTPMEEEPEWLEGIAEPEAEIPAGELPIPTPEAPDWLKGIAEPEAKTELPEDIAPTEQAPDWLTGIAEPAIEGEPTGEAPEWMQEFTEAAEEEPEPIVEEPSLEVPEEIDAELDVPELAEITAEPEAEMVLPAEAEHPAEVVSGEELDDDEVLGWLEGLAARQGVEEEELITAPEERVSELPSEMEMPAEEVVVEDIDIPEEPEEGLEWLERLADERGLDIDITPPAPVEIGEVEGVEPEAPDWLDQLATQPIPKITPELEAEIPDWLAGEEEVEPVEPAVEPTPPLPEVEAAVPTEAPAPEPTPEPVAEVEPVAPPEPVDVEPLPEVEPEAPPPAEPMEIEPELAIEPEVPHTPEPMAFEPEAEIPPTVPPAVEVPLEPVSEPPPSEPPVEIEAEPEVTPAVEPVPTEPIVEIEPEPTIEPVPVEPTVEVGAAVPLTPEPTEEPSPVEVVPIEPVDIAELVEPAAVEPTPVEPVPVEPTPAEPAVVEPPPAEPAPVEPTPAEPTAVEPTPVEPAPVEPTPVEPIEIEPVAEPPPEPAPTPEPVPTMEEPVPSPPKEKVTEPLQILDTARQALASDDIDQAVTDYRRLIKKKVELDRVIEDLRTALERDPNKPDLWQVLGDAYMENDQLTEAIDAYKRGMEVA